MVIEMDELFDIEISDIDIKAMVEMNQDIKNLSEVEIKNKIKILQMIDCSLNQILNIIGSNSIFLSKTDNDVINLIKYLRSKGFSTLNILFDSNPYISDALIDSIKFRMKKIANFFFIHFNFFLFYRKIF